MSMHSGWQNRWPKDFSSSVVQRSEHAQRMAEPLAKGFLVQRVLRGEHAQWTAEPLAEGFLVRRDPAK
jgi:hypothetical protein